MKDRLVGVIGRFLFVWFAGTSLFGCMGPSVLRQALPDYDETVSQLQGQSLLLNIARARHHMPPHFTGTTSIVATFNFETNAGITGNFPRSTSVYPSFRLDLGATVAENPTIELIPLRGEEFAKQLLTALDDGKFRLLASEGASLDMLIRLMGKAFRFQDRDGGLVRSVRNRPDIPDEYEEYRRIASHLSALNAKDRLFVGELSFIQTEKISLSGPPLASDVLTARKEGYEYRAVDGEKEYVLSRRIIDNSVVANFDPMIRPDAERVALNDVISLTPSNYVDIDIRPEYPGGEYPLRGTIQLRSFSEVLDFVARGIEEAPEYDVEVDSRTAGVSGVGPKVGNWQRNPSRSLTVIESDKRPKAGILHVRYRGLYYSIRQDPWDLAAFKTLYLILQMSEHTSPQRAFPITISK